MGGEEKQEICGRSSISVGRVRPVSQRIEDRSRQARRPRETPHADMLA